MDKSAAERVMASTNGIVRSKESNKEFLSTQGSMEGKALMPEKCQFQNRLVQIITHEKRTTNSKDNEIIKDRPILTSRLSNNSKTCDTEIFLRKDISEEPIDLNPWCKEWSTSCLDEELTLPQIDMQEEICIGRYTSLQSLQDPRSPSELFTTHQITNEREDSAYLPKEDMILDIDQPILDICNDPHNYFHVNVTDSTPAMKKANTKHLSEHVDMLDIPSKPNIWEISVLQNSDVMTSDMANCASIYLNNDEQQETFLNVKSHDKSVMFSPSLTVENDIFFETCAAVDPLETYQALEHSSTSRGEDTAETGMELSNNVITIDEVFVEQNDFSFMSNVFSYEPVEPSMELGNPTINFYASDVSCNNNNNKRSSNPSLSLKLVPDTDDCSISTPDVIANAISLEGEFNLLSYIEDEQTANSVVSDVKQQSEELSETECQTKKTISRNKTTKGGQYGGIRKKYEKRGRPPKSEGTDVKVEIIAGESVNNFKYRELRNKNNEASRRSRMLRKEREMQIMTTLHDLEKHNLNLINSVSHLEDECNKYRKKLLLAMSK